MAPLQAAPGSGALGILMVQEGVAEQLEMSAELCRPALGMGASPSLELSQAPIGKALLPESRGVLGAGPRPSAPFHQPCGMLQNRSPLLDCAGPTWCTTKSVGRGEESSCSWGILTPRGCWGSADHTKELLESRQLS